MLLLVCHLLQHKLRFIALIALKFANLISVGVVIHVVNIYVDICM